MSYCSILNCFSYCSAVPWPREAIRGYYHLLKVNPQTNGEKGASYNPHSRLSQDLASALKCLYLEKLANTGTDTVQVRVLNSWYKFGYGYKYMIQTIQM